MSIAQLVEFLVMEPVHPGSSSTLDTGSSSSTLDTGNG